MSANIKHQARVTQVLENAIEVVILTESACASCHVKSTCGMGESKEKRLLVETPEAPFFEPDETVDVYIEQIMGMKAVFFAYMLPFLFVMAVLFILLQAGCGELISGTISLGTLGGYYILLYLFRSKLSKEIVFTVKKRSA